ncbi:MAG: hypothetical protein ACD_56C00093G0001 [uncultured bacterium]|nr:MAG: hypothetical protein ACD_56C00093G0001 [uncultured bacterium]
MAPKRKTYIKNCTGEGCESSVFVQSNKMIGKVLFYVLLVLFVSSLIFILFFSMQMQINNIEITGTHELDAQVLKNNLESDLQGKYLNIVPKNNFLFISTGRVQKKLQEDYRKIRSVSVEKKFPDSITISIDEHEALLVWCRYDTECYLLDEEGVAYGKADFDSAQLSQNNLLKIGDDSDLEVAIGSKIMDSAYEGYALSLEGALQSLGIEVEDQYYTPSRMAEEIKVKSTSGYWIYFSTQFSQESSIKTLAAVLKKEIPKEKMSELEYVDLRSEYKAFYKFKGIQSAQPDGKIVDLDEKKN